MSSTGTSTTPTSACYHCGFCAFSKGRGATDLRGPAYNLELDEVARRTVEAAAAGATEVCLQGGIHPSFTGETYLNIVRAVKEAVPWMHVHAFSPWRFSTARARWAAARGLSGAAARCGPLDLAGHGRRDSG